MTDLTTQQIFTFEDSLYLLTAPNTWEDSQSQAQSFQGNLVTINNAPEHTFLAGLWAGQNLWTGYTDAATEGTFQWVSGENSAYTN